MADQLAAFAARLARFDRGAPIRLRAGMAWGRLPWDVLVCIAVDTSRDDSLDAASRQSHADAASGDDSLDAVPGRSRPEAASGDQVVDALTRRPRPDADWRVALPPPDPRVVEVVPAAVIRGAADAAAQTLREVSSGGLAGRAVGQRVVRDALLDHVVIKGRSDEDGSEFAVSQRLVQGIVRMRLLVGDNVDVLVAGPWTGLGTAAGSAWHRASSPLTLRPLR